MKLDHLRRRRMGIINSLTQEANEQKQVSLSCGDAFLIDSLQNLVRTNRQSKIVVPLWIEIRDLRQDWNISCIVKEKDRKNGRPL